MDTHQDSQADDRAVLPAATVAQFPSAVAVELAAGQVNEELVIDSFADFVVCVQMRPAEGSIWVDGRLVNRGWLGRAASQIHSPGERFRVISCSDFQVLRLAVPKPILDARLAELEVPLPGEGGYFAAGRIGTPSPYLHAAGCELLRCQSLPGEHAAMHAEALAMSMVTHLLLECSTRSRQAGRRLALAETALAPWQVRRLMDFIEAHLHGDLSLDSLARVLGLSKFHFCRAFKEAVGLPPHQWVM